MLFKSLMTVAAVLVALYLTLCAWMFVRQRDLIYFPQYTRIAAQQTDFSIENDGVVLRGWLANPGRRDAIIYFGGNAESLLPMRDALAQWFPDRSIYLLAYRGFGASDGAPGEAAITADAVALFDEVRQRHPQGAVSVIGRSLGSGVASALAARRPVAKLVLVTPFDSLANVAKGHYPWLPVGLLMRERYESAKHLAAYPGPVLIVRAGRDTIVPPVRTQRLVESLTRPPTMLDLPTADHINVDDAAEFRHALVRFLQQET